MLKEIIEVYEELKQNTYYIDRGDRNPIMVNFNNEHFYHLLGLHYLNLDIYFPKQLKSKDSKYRYIKKRINKFEKIIKNHLKGKDSVELRINSFLNVKKMFDDNSAVLYNLKNCGIMFEGDYGLFKIFEYNIYCLLALVSNDKEKYNYVPQSWMVSTRKSRMLNKIPDYYQKIIIFPKNMGI